MILMWVLVSNLFSDPYTSQLSVISKTRRCWIHHGIHKARSSFQCNNTLKPSIRFELGRNLNKMSHTRRLAATPQPVTPRDLRVLYLSSCIISILINTLARVYGMYALPPHNSRFTSHWHDSFGRLFNDCY